ncbi:MAG: serine/threonine-protein kinase [Coprobacillaceae bacterium]
MKIEWVNEKYKSIAVIDKNWRILKHRKTGVLYLLKQLNRYDITLFEYLKENPHPNIVRIEDYYKENDILWVIEEYLQGQTLEFFLQERTTLTEGEVIRIITEVCLGLQHLHNLPIPIIHRDIKLANIMIDQYMHITIIDFDVSRFYKQETNMDTTILGTEGYAAPEQFGFTQTDQRSDIYSVGIVMNYLLTGLHLKEFVYEGRLGEIIKKSTNFDPTNRYHNMEMFLSDLHRTKTVEIKKKGTSTPFWVLPGFRTKKIPKMIVALFGYVLCFNSVTTYVSKYTNETMIAIDYVLRTLILISLIILYTDYLKIQSHLEFFSSPKTHMKIIGYVSYSFVILLIYACLAVILSNIFE